VSAASDVVTPPPIGHGPLENLPDQAPRCVIVLAASPLAEDHTSLQALFHYPNWRVHSARTYQEAEAILRENRVEVVICCESIFPDGHSWMELLDVAQTMKPPPPMIVADRLADNWLWAEVLRLGAFDLLMKPFDATEVFRVVSLAASQQDRGGVGQTFGGVEQQPVAVS
jgi:DNA-binding NtrC family response regulator